MISKLVEVIMLDKIEMYMNTNPNQFGFKRKHGTDQCIYVLFIDITMAQTVEKNAGLGHAWQKAENDVPFHRSARH